MSSVRRIAIQHPYARNFAETESAMRIITAATRLGIEARECTSPDEVMAFQPDFVLAISHQDAKLTPFPTYGVMTQPVNYYHMSKRLLHNTLTYDAYLTTSPVIETWIKDITFGARKTPIIGFYANTVPSYPFTPIDLTNPSLAYFGSNWDGSRFKDVFTALAERPDMRIFGREESWKHVNPTAYHGTVPFDGESALTVYREAGVGLCLYLDEFSRDHLANNRLFEITAAGAVTISGHNPFAERIFGDSLLYVDMTAPLDTILNQIDDHMQWVRGHPERAAEMAQRAHTIFTETLSLDALLPNVLAVHRQVMETRSTPPKAQIVAEEPKITCIMRTGGRPAWMLERAVSSVARQSFNNVRIHYVAYRDQDGLDDMAARYPNIEHIIDHVPGGNRSDTLWHGLSRVSSAYFTILDDDDEIFPNHYASLLSTFEKNSGHSALGPVGVCYSGSIEVCDAAREQERADSFDVPRVTRIRMEQYSAYDVHEFAALRLSIGPYCCLIKSNMIDTEILDNPGMSYSEDLYLLHLLATKTAFAFSWDVSAVHHMHGFSQSGYLLNSYGDTVRALRRLHGRNMPGPTPISWQWCDPYDSSAAEEKKREFIHNQRLVMFLREKGFIA
ncbi:MAG: glycosyltransferase [Rhodospirillaceae bacterium]|nr:glycosyltransferase [Rhodospirillaceae bacterium]